MSLERVIRLDEDRIVDVLLLTPRNFMTKYNMNIIQSHLYRYHSLRKYEVTSELQVYKKKVTKV